MHTKLIRYVLNTIKNSGAVTEEEENELYQQLSEYRQESKPVIILNSPIPSVQLIAQQLADAFNFKYVKLNQSDYQQEPEISIAALSQAYDKDSGIMSFLPFKASAPHYQYQNILGFHTILVIPKIVDYIDQCLNHSAADYFFKGIYSPENNAVDIKTKISAIIQLQLPWFLHWFISWQQIQKFVDIEVDEFKFSEVIDDISLFANSISKKFKIQNQIEPLHTTQKRSDTLVEIKLATEHHQHIERLLAHYPKTNFNAIWNK